MNASAYKRFVRWWMSQPQNLVFVSSSSSRLQFALHALHLFAESQDKLFSLLSGQVQAQQEVMFKLSYKDQLALAHACCNWTAGLSTEGKSHTFPTDSTQNANLHISFLKAKLVALSQSLEYFQQNARTVGLFNRDLGLLSIRTPEAEGEPGVMAQQDAMWRKKNTTGSFGNSC